MNLTLFLPWFPIILAVGVGGRLLGRARGFAMGILCAMFWVALVQASAGGRLWQEPWTLASLVVGIWAIIAMGGWAGELSVPSHESEPRVRRAKVEGPAITADQPAMLDQIATAADQFDDWLEKHRDMPNPWPKFDEFLRSVLYTCCQATHIRPYQLSAEGQELEPLQEPDPFLESTPLSARKGIIGHVATTGRCFVGEDHLQGELVEELAQSHNDPIAWCFAITQGSQHLGVVVVGQLGLAPASHRSLLSAVERLINLFWCALSQATRSRSVACTDPSSSLLTREAFLQSATCALKESYRRGEPVALAVIALERLRELNDSGRWEVADQILREVGATLRSKVRLDDRVGRFDGSRMVVLFRRVDSELASLIVGQMMSRLTVLCHDHPRWGVSIDVWCGVVGSGTETPDLRTLLTGALLQCQQARIHKTQIASDLKQAVTAMEPVT